MQIKKWAARYSLVFAATLIVVLLAAGGASSMESMEANALSNPLSKEFEVQSPNGPFPTTVVIPVRWCILAGAPSQINPGLVGESNIKDVLWRRHERPTDNHYIPQADITFRSGATFSMPTFPLLTDPNISPGSQPGDVLDDDFDSGAEFNQVINLCRSVWSIAAPGVTGITAVHIRRFVDNSGTPTSLLGLGGRATVSNAAEQMIAGRAMVIDNAFLLPGSPLQTIGPDPVDKLTGHEFGHALSLRHGDGIDNDSDGIIDNEGDTLNGPNLMQYRFFPPDGITITAGQATQARSQTLLHIPDAAVTTLTGAVVNAEIPLGNTAVDPIGEADPAYGDVGEFGAAVDPSTGLTYLLANMAAAMPEAIDPMQAAFLVDTDGNPQTGGNPEELQLPGVPGAAGVELVGVVSILKGHTTRVRLFEFTPGLGYQLITDDKILSLIVPQLLHHDTFSLKFQDYEFIGSHAVHIQIPSDLIKPFEMNFTMQLAISDASGFIDEARGDLTFETVEYPSCMVMPLPVRPFEKAIIMAEGLPPGEAVHALFGPDVVGKGTTDRAGNVSIPFEVPAGAHSGARLVTVGLDDPDNAITADCTATVEGQETWMIELPIILGGTR